MLNHLIGVVATLFFLMFLSCVEEGEDTKGLTAFSGILAVVLFGAYIGMTKSWGLVIALVVLALHVAKYLRPDNVKHVQSRDKS